VNERHAVTLLADGVVERRPDKSLGTGLGHGLDADAGVRPDRPPVGDFEKPKEAPRIVAPFLELETGVDVLGVLPEDHHVDLLGVLHRRWDSGEPSNGTQAHVEVEDLAEGDVERTETAPDGRRERALDTDEMVSERLDGVLRKPFAGLVERLLAGENLLPGDTSTVLVGCCIEHALGRRPDVDADAVTLDVGDDRLGGHLQLASR
jgi:hypothetical protein